MSNSQGPFSYLKPTDEQAADMERLRDAAANYAKEIQDVVPEGPDKTYIIRQLRSVAMWVNVAISRHPNGDPR